MGEEISGFYKKKKPVELNSSDVKEFIPFLAIEKRVSANI